MPWNFRITGRRGAGAVLRESHSTCRVEETLVVESVLFCPFVRFVPCHKPFRAGVGTLTGRLGSGRAPAHDQLRHRDDLQ